MMLFIRKKIRDFVKALDSSKKEPEIQNFYDVFDKIAPAEARPEFKSKLKNNLLLKHQAMAKQQNPEAKQDARKKVSFSVFKSLSLAGAFVFLLLITALVGYPLIPAPQVEGYTLKDAVRKISYNAPIKIVFNQPMEHSSVERAFKVEPNLSGKFEWSGNTMKFVPDKQLKIGDSYTVRVGSDAKSMLMKQINSEYSEIYQIVPAPKVALFNPAPDSTDIAIDSKLTIAFDRPMIPLASLKNSDALVPSIKMEPNIQGKYRWLGTSTLSFIPDKLANATTYTVTIPKGIVAADGGTSEEDYKYTFSTQRPELTSSNPDDLNEFNGPKTKVRLVFNQKIDLNSLQNNVKVLKYNKPTKPSLEKEKDVNPTDKILKSFKAEDWDTIPYKAEYLNQTSYKEFQSQETDPNSNFIDETFPTTEEMEKTVVLSPSGDLPYDSLFLVKIEKDLKGQEGSLTVSQATGFTFKTVGKLSIKSTKPTNGETSVDFSNYSPSIEFSQPVDQTSLKDRVLISPQTIDSETNKPAEAVFNADLSSGNVFIQYPFKPSTDYTLTIKAGVKDQFSQTLDQDTIVKFKTSRTRPQFELQFKSDISLLDASKPAIYYVKSINVGNITSSIKKLTEDEFKAVYLQGFVNTDKLNEIKGPFNTWTTSIKQVENKEIVTTLDLAKESNQKIEPGYYYLQVSSNEVVDRDNNPVIYKQLFIVTNSGLAVKKSPDKLLVWATDLKTGNPVENMDITVERFNSSLKLSAKTNKDGIAQVDLPKAKDENDLYNSDYTVWGKTSTDTSFAHVSWSEGIAPWNFNVDYDQYPSQYYVYAYTDRPIYRPGNTVYFKGIVRKDLDTGYKLPDTKKAHVKITDSQGNSIYEKDLSLNANGSFSDQYQIGQAVQIGTYDIQITITDPDAPALKTNTYYASFRLAEYRKPDFELNLKSDKTNYVNGEKATIKVDAKYYFGAAMPNADIEYSVNSSDYYFFIPTDSNSIYNNQWYSFSDEGYLCYWGCASSSKVVSTGKAKLDQNGQYTIEVPLNIKEKSLSQFYTVEVTASNQNNQTVSNRVTFPVHKGDYYVGVLNDDYLVKQGDNSQFQVITVDSSGQPVSGKNVKVELFERNWNTIKKKNVDGGYYYENSYDDKIVETKNTTTDGKGHSTVSFKMPKGGMYKIKVSSVDSRGNNISASTTIYSTSSDFVNWGRDNNDKIELVADKLEYKPGETAKVLVKSPYQNVYALVSEERQSILNTKVVKIASNSQTIEIPITEQSIPNIFVNVLLVKGSGNIAGLTAPESGVSDERNVAAIKMGYATLQVNTQTKKLNIDISSDKKIYHPGDEVTLNVTAKDSTGKPRKADFSIGVVDKSVLALTENVTADLLNSFYRKRFLSVSTAESLTKALSRVNVQVEAGMKGGGGSTIKKRGTFKDTAYWEANVSTNEQGQATVKFKLPDNLTTWQALAIGTTTDTIVGSQKTEFQVSKDILIRSVLPRFLIIDDQVSVGAIVHNYTEKTQNVEVSMDAKGVSVINGGKTVITLNPREEKKVSFDVKAQNQEQASFTFKAVAQDNPSLGDILDQTLPIHSFSFPETVSTSLTIDDSAKHIETVWLPTGIDTNIGSLTLMTAPTLAGTLTKGLDYLMTYPYGCTEQTSSALLPNVVLKQVAGLPGLKGVVKDEKTLQKNVDTGLEALYKYQQPNGGFGIWSTSETTPYLTSYVLYTLNETKKAGYSVDNTVISRGTDFLKNHISTHPLSKPVKNTQKEQENIETRYQANVRAYALYVLSELNAGDLSLANNLYEFKSSLNTASKAYLAMDYQKLLSTNKAAKDDIQKKIDTLKTEILNTSKENQRGIHFEEQNPEYRIFDTNTRTTAIVLQMLTRIDPSHPYISKIVRNLLYESQSGTTKSTQEMAVSLISLVEYLKTSKELTPDYNVVIAINNIEKLNKSYTKEGVNSIDTQTISLKDLQTDNKDNEISITKNGVGKLYTDLTLKYYLPTDKVEPRDEGMAVTHDYFGLNSTNDLSPLTQIKEGDTVKIKMSVVVPEDRYYVMVEDYLPAGLEAIDSSLSTSKQYVENTDTEENSNQEGNQNIIKDNNWYFNYQEVRDDRMTFFADYLPKGVYELTYYARATSKGIFRDLPAVAQELYFPEVFGRSEGKIIEIK